MAKHVNGWHHDAHHVSSRQKVLISFHFQGLRMILSELEVCGLLKKEAWECMTMGVNWEL